MTDIQTTEKDIKILVSDLDDTCKKQVEPMVEGLEKGRDKLARIFRKRTKEYEHQLSSKKVENGLFTLEQLEKVHERMSKANAEMIQESMARVFARHGTTDYHYLVQEMDIFRWIYGDLDPDVFEIMKAEFVEVMKLTMRQARDKNNYSRPFPGIVSMLKTLKEYGIACYAYSNAPMYQVLERLKQSGLLPYFDVVYGTRDKVAQVMPTLIETKIKLGEFGRDTKWKVVAPKPEGRLDEILGVDPDYVSRHVMVLGDSEGSDGGLAKNNGCLHVKPGWGGVTPDIQERIGDFSNPELEAKHKEENAKKIVEKPGYERIVAPKPGHVQKIIRLKRSS